MNILEQHELFDQILESENRDKIDYPKSQQVVSDSTKSLIRKALVIDEVLEVVEIDNVFFSTVIVDQKINSRSEEGCDYAIYPYPNGLLGDFDIDNSKRVSTIEEVRRSYQQLRKRYQSTL